MSERFPMGFTAWVQCPFCEGVFPCDVYEAAPSAELESCGWHIAAHSTPPTLGIAVQENIKVVDRFGG